MKTYCLVALLSAAFAFSGVALASPAAANNGPTNPSIASSDPQYTYQDGILQGFHREASESSDQYGTVYTVKSGGATYILTPRGDRDESKGGLLTRALIAHSVLDQQPPRTPIKIRSDGRHFFVKIGDRESEYSVARVD